MCLLVCIATVFSTRCVLTQCPALCMVLVRSEMLLLADGLGGFANEVRWSALPSVMIELKPVDLGSHDECKSTAADLSSRIII
jgi:hypothetical protein